MSSTYALHSYQATVEYIQKYLIQTHYKPIQDLSHTTYDVFDCPPTPPPGYPREYNVMDVLGNWSITDVRQQESRRVHQGVCVFDYATNNSTSEIDERIQRYRQAEVPFVIRNDPAVVETVVRWSHVDYLEELFHGKLFEATLANTTHMTYYSRTTATTNNFRPPTRFAPMSFTEWYRRAHDRHPGEEYAYLRVDACLEHNQESCDATYLSGAPLSDADFLYTNDLHFFHPDNQQHYSVDTKRSRGIQCRFGAPGLIAENHFDNERNLLVLLGGERRYLLSHPANCPHMYLYPQGHPLERHSQVNWSEPESQQHSLYPHFSQTTVNEVVLQAGDVLYLPTFWFHHIVSLTTNYQCNTRSGYSVEYDQLIYDCGFFYDFPE